MEVRIFKNYSLLCQEAAQLICQSIEQKPDLKLGLATGSTPEGVYQQLIASFKRGKVDFSQVTTFNLDEYVGLRPDHAQSYHYYMEQHFFKYVNVAKHNQYLPDGAAQDLSAACAAFDEALHRQGGIDLQLLGLGRNGHIGFNEPGTNPYQRTHVVQLAAHTLEDNARFFHSMDEVPRKAITMGLSSILESKQILLLVSGQEKAEVVQQLMQQSISKQLPASYLKEHPAVRVFLDEAAASLL